VRLSLFYPKSRRLQPVNEAQSTARLFSRHCRPVLAILRMDKGCQRRPRKVDLGYFQSTDCWPTKASYIPTKLVDTSRRLRHACFYLCTRLRSHCHAYLPPARSSPCLCPRRRQDTQARETFYQWANQLTRDVRMVM
jgi:hypothetical protein